MRSATALLPNEPCEEDPPWRCGLPQHDHKLLACKDALTTYTHIREGFFRFFAPEDISPVAFAIRYYDMLHYAAGGGPPKVARYHCVHGMLPFYCKGCLSRFAMIGKIERLVAEVNLTEVEIKSLLVTLEEARLATSEKKENPMV